MPPYVGSTCTEAVLLSIYGGVFEDYQTRSSPALQTQVNKEYPNIRIRSIEDSRLIISESHTVPWPKDVGTEPSPADLVTPNG